MVWDIYGPYMGMIWVNLWAIYGVHMVLIWDITHHIIPIEKASEADEPLLWNIYGPYMGHNLPYQTHTFSLVRACWSCICRSIEKFTFKVQRGTLAQSSGDCALVKDYESDRVRE